MTTRHIHLATAADTAQLGTRLAPALQVGDCILLDGDIGAGKTTFARALIQSRLGRAEDVPSPTFTLVQTYDDPGGDIWHCDLYRLSHPDEAIELGLLDAFSDAICLIEWPDRLGSDVPNDAGRMSFVAGDDGHTVTCALPAHLMAVLDG